jgi:hypothetical protein
MTLSEKLVGVADGTMTELEWVMRNVQIEVQNFEFFADIVVMDMANYTMALGRSFPNYIKSSNQHGIHGDCAYVKRSVHDISSLTKESWERYSTECHALEIFDPYGSHGSIEPTCANQEDIKENRSY